MAITVQAGTGVAAAASATLTPPLPASVATGDLLLLLVDITQDETVASSGYTQIHSSTFASDGFKVLTKTAGSGETAPVVTLGSALDVCAMVIRVRGCDIATGPAQLTTNSTSTTTASIDPPIVGSVKIAVIHGDPTTAGSITWTGGATGLGEIGYLARAFIAAAYKIEDTAGALTYTTTVVGTMEALILSIAPATAAPVADFTGTPLTGSVPLSVTFTDASTNSPTSWLWDFGDGTTSTAQNPSHSYPAGGAYTVVLTATNTNGSNTKTRTGYVTATEAIAYATGGGVSIW